MSKFLFHRWVDIVLFISTKQFSSTLNISDISYATRITNWVVIDTLRDLESVGCVTTKLSGRVRNVYLTPKGLELANELNKIRNIISNE